MWFQELVGFVEESPEQVRKNLSVNGNTLCSLVNNRSYRIGHLAIPSLEELRIGAKSFTGGGRISVEELVGDVQALHHDVNNANAVFQVASQFNLLEMAHPGITPEMGVTRYANDLTQGPACAIACGAGTIYRNYFVPLGSNLGQQEGHQVDCLRTLGEVLENEQFGWWKMSNGYAMCTTEGLLYLNKYLYSLTPELRFALQGKLKIGVQSDTEVTLAGAGHVVTQVYCSALPVAYGLAEFFYWERFARFILEAGYEATLWIGLQNHHRTGCNKVFLTMLGGGAFGNEVSWVVDSIYSAMRKFIYSGLDIRIVSYGSSNPVIQDLIKEINLAVEKGSVG